MNFTLYNYVLSGNCYKIRLMAALLGAKYENVAVDFYPGYEHRSDKMLALNPAGTLPVLQAGSLVLTETQAMLTWLAKNFDPTDSWFPTQDPERLAEIVEWLGFSNRLTQSAGIARLHDMLNWPVDGDAAKTAAIHDLRAIELRLMDRVFEGGLWLAGDTPTIADIACFPYVALSPDAGIEHDGYPAIRNWLYAVRALPGFITMPGIHYLHELNESASA
ncbi:MAG: glutathione S-transferase family protein [Pseudomonadota bacterium]